MNQIVIQNNVGQSASRPRDSFAGFLSLCCPGLGQLVQGRLGSALFWHLAAWLNFALLLLVIGFVTLPLCWYWCAKDAATWQG